MTQSQKIKVILKKAYEIYRTSHNRDYYDLVELLHNIDIIADYQEVINIGKRLQGDGLFNFVRQ